MDRLTRQLSLTAEQQSQIKPLLVDRQQKMQALFQEQSLSREDRRARAETIASETKGKIEAVLNDQQKQKYEAMQERMRHGGGNGEGAPAGGTAAVTESAPGVCLDGQTLLRRLGDKRCQIVL